MKRIEWLSLAFAVVGFGCVGGTPCDPSADPTTCKAGGYCHPELKICVANDAGLTGGGGGSTGGGGGTTGGGMGGGATGGGGTTGGGTGGGGAMDCRNATNCQAWEECAPSVAGGTCVDSDLVVVWTSPASGAQVRAMMVTGTLTVKRRDGGVVAALTEVPVGGADGGVFRGSNGVFTGQLLLPAPDGVKSFDAGWGPMGPGASTTVVRNVDPPSLSIDAVPAAVMGSSDGGFDTRVPGGAAYRKDEAVLVRVRSTSLDADGDTFRLRAQRVPDTATTLMPMTDCSTANVDVCREFRLDLSLVEMKSFRGDVTLTATGSDVAGNGGSSAGSQTVPVTRFRWGKFVGATGAVSGVLTSTPAIGTGGVVYVAVANGARAGMVGVNSDGTESWASASGAVAGVPVIGSTPANGEWLMFQQATAGGAVLSYNVGVTTGVTCSPPPTTNNQTSSGGLVLVGSDTVNVGSVALQGGTAATGGGMIGRLTVPLNASGCNPTATGGLSRVAAPGNMVANANSVFFVDNNNDLKRLDYSLPGVPSLLQQPTLANINPGVGIVNGLVMLSGTRVAGGGGPGIGKLFAFEIDGGVAWNAPTPLTGPTSGPAVGAGVLFAQYRQSNASSLLRVDAATGVVQASLVLPGSAFTGNDVGTPALGADGNVYAVDETGGLFVVARGFASDAGVEWAAPLDAAFGNAVRASPTLDCNRKAGVGGGVIYIATDSGWLVSYLVDARGLDPMATWPKYARDARNSGNISGPSIGCP